MTSFDERYMATDRMLKGSGMPGFGASNRTPSTSRVERNFRAQKLTKPVKKGLPRTAVVVKRISPRCWEVADRSSGKVFAHINNRNGSYGWKKVFGDGKPHAGYATLKAATEALLLKV